MIYLKRRICDWHWEELADDVPALYEALNVGKRERDPKYEELAPKVCQ